MNREQLQKLLEQVKSGGLEIDAALKELKNLPYEDLGFAKVDHHRALRRGFPEVIFCTRKTASQVTEIFERMVSKGSLVMASRADNAVYEKIKSIAPEAQYFEQARIVLSQPLPEPTTAKKIAVITAGTSDIPVAEEAAVTARAMGNPVETIYDVGVAGMHRLLSHKEQIQQAHVLVVVAGMEGALASVIGGLVDKPIVAVPTSVGYGASFEGMAALLAMLNSCAPGVAVVNIDNGFGAGYYAGLINQLGNKE